MANENNTAVVSQALLGANDKGQVIYQVNGEDVKLSFNTVRNYLTRGSASVTDGEVIQFIFLCKANRLNPFTGDAWLVKYDGKTPAQMLTARDAFMRRAEASELYDGYQSGVIVLRNNQVVETEGAFFLRGDQLLGGWAKVFRKDRKIPTYQRVRLEEYNSGKSTWSQKPATMIQKVAEAQAFRKAFPLNLGGLYTPEEMPDEQPQREQEKMPENAEKPVFIDAPHPEVIADPEPAEEAQADQEQPAFTPDPEPEPLQAQDTQEDDKMDLFKLS